MKELENEKTPNFTALLSSEGQPTAKRLLAGLVLTFALVLNLYHLYAGYFGPPDAHTFRSVHLSLILVLTFLIKPFTRKTGGAMGKFGAVFDFILIALVVACQAYVSYDVNALANRIGELNRYDVVMGTIMIILTVEATRRVIGWPMVAICVIFLLHTAYTDRFFGFLYGPPTSWKNIIDMVVIQDQGLYGIPIMVSASYIMLFLIFGAVLIESRAGLFFTNIALALTGRQTGGPAKASVVASGLMGTLSGAAVANVVMTGSFTIPLMKRVGYRPSFAGAVEAAASSGGLIMPPIMGAAAFIMAMFLNKPYLQIAIAGAVPAVLYFFSIFCGVHFEAKRRGLTTVPKDELPDLWTEVKRGGHLFVSVIALIVLLAAGRSVPMAAFWAIACVFFLTFLRPETRLTPVRLLAVFERAASTAIPVAISCASAGIVVGCVFTSGVGVKFSGVIIALAHNQLWIALILTMLACIVLGTGLTVTAVYVTMVALTVPALIELGVSPLAAHFFCFYFGVASGLTPPVCIPAYVAAGVAEAPPMKTGVTAFTIGLAKYLLPYMFVFSDQLFLIGSFWSVFLAVSTATIGIVALSAGVAGYWKRPCNMLERGALLAASLLLIKPGLEGDLVGLGLVVLVFLFQWGFFSWRRAVDVSQG
ncbi:MAG: TRAP transporter permease [Deltaproteobacteria bacterium]|nr:TRAP transporter permease [Deltaproteobacteria bacterium]